MTHPGDWVASSDTDSYALLTRSGRHRDDGADAADWGHHVTTTIADQIKFWRTDRGLSAQQLSDRSAELGYRVPRNIIANIESGRRSAVMVHELLILAMALNIPPILLVYPLGRQERVEVVPGYEAPTWSAFRWFAASKRPTGPLLGGSVDEGGVTEPLIEWEKAHLVVQVYRRHDSLVNRYRFTRDDTMNELRRLAEPSERMPDERETRRITDRVARDLAKAAEALRVHRQDMRSRGYQPPRLPVDIDVDED
ncbi:helix-turn-helix domain-containing protein [Dactylosporangium sp. CA-233914]|uniref:helix-turn-helix domain-containing protein n=1 Tax=Dactylosporangium sp. CA-233914 TaxID=3239934 RepID=UPI003D941825